MAKLTAGQQDAIREGIVSGASHRDIARQLGISPGTVSSYRQQFGIEGKTVLGRDIAGTVGRVARRVAAGETLSSAVRNERTTAASVRKYSQDRNIFDKRDGRYVIGDAIVHMPVMTTDGRLQQGIALDDKTASLMGRYWNEVQQAMRGKPSDLASFNITITDVFGNRYQLMTDADALQKHYLTQGDPMAGVKKFYERKRPSLK
jgi:transposase-like protein